MTANAIDIARVLQEKRLRSQIQHTSSAKVVSATADPPKAIVLIGGSEAPVPYLKDVATPAADEVVALQWVGDSPTIIGRFS